MLHQHVLNGHSRTSKEPILYNEHLYTPNANMADHSVGARDELYESGESTKHAPLVHGPPPWTGSMDRVHQNMDRVHGPPIFT